MVIGAGGFVGKVFCSRLRHQLGNDVEIFAFSRHADSDRHIESLDLLDVESVTDVVTRIQPSHVVNLAGLARPAASAENPQMAWHLHARAPEQLGRAILANCATAHFLHVSTGLVYGSTAYAGRPMDEECLLAPLDLYGVTKAAGDLAVGSLAREGLKCLRVRPFNHTGPGQSTDFAVPAFAAQVAAINARRQLPSIRVGNLTAKRDFLDVRDVADAYIRIALSAEVFAPGEIVNVASGTPVGIDEILSELLRLGAAEISVVKDQAKWRPVDVPVIFGSNDKLSRLTGWRRRYTLTQTLIDTLAAFS